MSQIKKVIYSNPVTVVFWKDGTKTMSRCDEYDNYDELTGFLMCVMKKAMKAKDMRKMLEDYVYGNDKEKIKRDEKKVDGAFCDTTLKEMIEEMFDVVYWCY